MALESLLCFGSNKSSRAKETELGSENIRKLTTSYTSKARHSGDLTFAYASEKADGLAQVHARRSSDSQNPLSSRLVPIPESCSSSVLNLENEDSEDVTMMPIELSRDLFKKLTLKPPQFSAPHTTSQSLNKFYAIHLDKLFLRSQYLNFCSRHICKIVPESFNQLERLSSLQLCCNNLKTLPKEICLLRNLTVLVVSNNQLTYIPDTIGFLINLAELRLDKNRLTDLPRTISGLQTLKILSIADNLFAEIPRSIIWLTRLITLECSGNPLRAIPAEITRFSQLQRFHLNDCSRILKESEFAVFEREEAKLGACSLLESCVRTLIRHKRPVLYSLPKHLRDYISSASECTFCSGPVMEKCAVRCRMIRRMERKIPVVQVLCCNHWLSERDRRRAILSSYPSTTPPHLVSTDLRDRKGPIVPFNRYDPFMVSRSRRLLAKYSVDDRLNLMVPLSLIITWPEYPRKDV